MSVNNKSIISLMVSVFFLNGCFLQKTTDGLEHVSLALENKHIIHLAPSSDLERLRKEYAKNPKRWEMAFDFFKNTDLEKIAVGHYDIDGKNVYATIQQYETRNEENTRFEAHKVYADIQYLIQGQEKIGLTDFAHLETSVPYNMEKDIAFYTSKEEQYHLADTSQFFLFFPSDPHRPCVKVDKNQPVKKLVIKIKLTD